MERLSAEQAQRFSHDRKGKGEELKEQLALHFPHCEVDALTVPKEGSIIERNPLYQVKSV